MILTSLHATFEDDVTFEIFDKLNELPYFNPDLDNGNVPTSVIELRKKIESADAVLFCTPEYVFSLPGVLKNALEWCVSTTVFSGKPVAIIVAAANGTKALESLQLILTTIQCRIIQDAVLLIQGAKGKIQADGNIASDLREKLECFSEALIHDIQINSTENNHLRK